MKKIFLSENIPVNSIQLGKIETSVELDEQKRNLVKNKLRDEGFEWLDDNRSVLVENIKQTIINLVHHGELDEMRENLSVFLAKTLKRDYNSLSQLFSSIEGITIEHYFILQKIEKAKEWLVYGEFNLKEIAYKLGYSSTAHLSAQFKKVTGLTATDFKNLTEHRRNPIDKINGEIM